MKSHELAKKLLEMEDCEVTVNGYEGGVSIVENISFPDELALNVHTEWYYGKHEYDTNNDYVEEYKDKQKIKAIHIS